MKNFQIYFKGLLISLCCSIGFATFSTHAEKLGNERIVSAGGSVTEILFALDLGAQIVAVDTSSLYPVEATTLPKIGYYRQLSPEGVLAQKPDILVGHSSMGPEDVLSQISTTDVEVLHVEHDYSVESLYGLIDTLAKRFKQEEAGKKLIAHISNELNTVSSDISSQPNHSNTNTLAFFASVGSRGLVAAGTKTMPSTLFKLAGANNAFADLEGYKPISPESLLVAKPSRLFIPSHAAAGQSVEKLCQLPALRMWAELTGCNITVVDPLVFMGLSPRLANGVALIKDMKTSK